TSDSNYSVFTTDIVANKTGSGILINTDGELVGIVMQDYAASSTNTLTALAIAELEPVIDLLCDGSDVPYIGLDISTVTEKIANEYDIPKGVYIKEVEMDSPAMIAGLQSGDVITSIDGKSVMTDSAYSSEILGLTPGETYPITVMRQGSSDYSEIIYDVTVSTLK
ncbi:MAG: PDZ domain-containing protein, partial [Clostridiales bacterium]|nr:PDZ domain-containing protein [Clostridiales bacterium]